MTMTEPHSQTAPAEPTQRSRRPLIIAGAGVVSVIAVGLYAAGWTSVMGVNSIEVYGNEVTSAEQLIETAGIAEGTPMMRVDVRVATSRLADLPQLASVDVSRAWPRTVVLSVSERQAVAVQKAQDGWDLVDSNAVPFVVSPQKPKDLPVLERSDDEMTNTAMLQALSGMSEQIRAKVATISALSPSSIRLTLRKSDAVVNWGSSEQSDYKSQVLAVLLSTDAGWYDVSNPDTPATADEPPVVRDDLASDAEATPSASLTPVVPPTPAVTPTPGVTPTPAADGEVPVGVVTD
jgi:cell division protein FtsQ